MSAVVVRAPATVANLGPGFDALGCALAWYDEVRVELSGGGLEITAAGPGADGVKRDETNFVAMGLRAVLGELPGARIHVMRAVAFGRGFGSSAIGIVAGLVAGRALGETAHTGDDLLRLATEIEGHPDNVAPCLLGGVTIVAGVHAKRLPPPEGIAVLVGISPNRLATKTARGVLPETLPRADAAGNAARAALLAAALATSDAGALLAATGDVLHQPARFELMPDTGALVDAMRARGFAAFLSGAGPSMAAFVPAANAADAEAAARDCAPEGWSFHVEAFDAAGATVVEQR
jgi:homoserine kinase